MSEPTLIHLDPACILLADNARFAPEVPLEDAEQMRASILDVGRIMEPVGVIALAEPVKGFTHQLRYGFRRVAGAMLANEAGAGVPVPALVLDEADAVGTLKEQVSENVVRKTLSLMDIAVSARKLLDAGMSRTEVRTTFTRPVGTKGGGIKPASPAWLNMVLALLDLPKTIQARIHSGDIGLAAAYRLCKAPADKRQAILDAADKDAQKVRDIEAKEEQQFEALESRIAETEQGLVDVVTAIDTTKAEVELAQINLTEKQQAIFDAEEKLANAKQNIKAAEDDKEKDRAKKSEAKAKEKLNKAKEDLKSAEGRLEAEQKRLTKAEASKQAVADKAAQLREQLAQKRDAPAPKVKKAKGVSPAAIEKASKEAGVDVAKKRLTGPEMRKCIEDLSMITSYPIVASIGQILKDCFDSTITDGLMVKKLAAITGEKAPKGK